MNTFEYGRACVRATKIVVPELSDQNSEGFTVPPDRPTLSKRSGVRNYYCTYLRACAGCTLFYTVHLVVRACFSRPVGWGGGRGTRAIHTRCSAHIENNKLLPDHHRSDTTTRVHGFSPFVMTTIVIAVPTAVIPFAGDT